MKLLGITAIEMAQGQPPHSQMHPMRAIFLIPSRPPPTLLRASDFSVHFNDFLAKCLQKDPELRPSATELLQVKRSTTILNISINVLYKNVASIPLCHGLSIPLALIQSKDYRYYKN